MKRWIVVVAMTLCLTSSGCLTMLDSDKRSLDVTPAKGFAAIVGDGAVALGPTAVVGSSLGAWALWWTGLLVVDFTVMAIRAR